ncbi:MAG TPA: D-alanyl-D-alanine carboxypeptidase family protein [Rubrobacteraceae bacterium]|nr:D-alanyl-D-alanine carboxypeptidase family protein [Rubrobacteraceae bacterium]
MGQTLYLVRITKVVLAFAVLAFLIFSPTASGAQETTTGGETMPQQQAPDPPEIDAEAWSLMDAASGTYLGGENPDERLSLASTTKIMAALVVLEEGVDLQREIAVPPEAEEFVGVTYSNVGLIAGERLTVRDLLIAALVPSGTDAVYTLAYALGDGSVDNFVEKMNEQASSMDLENTNFDSPAGLDSPDNYSSARDLARIAQAAMEYPVFAEIVSMTEPTINTQNREIQIVTTNSLLYYYPQATGIKTGTSPEAGPSLVASAEDGGESYIAVILGASEDQYRFMAAETLLAYGFEDFERRPLVEQNEQLEELQVPFRPEESVALVASEEVVGPAGPGLDVEQRVNTREPPPSAEAGQELGTVEVLVDGQKIGQSPLEAESGYEEASFWTKTWYRIRSLFE